MLLSLFFLPLSPNLIIRTKWQGRQRTTCVSLIPLSPPSHLHIMSHLDDMCTDACTRTHGCWHTKTRARAIRCTKRWLTPAGTGTRSLWTSSAVKKWPLRRPPPRFWQRWDFRLGSPATLPANGEAAERGGDRGVSVELVPGGGGEG